MPRSGIHSPAVIPAKAGIQLSSRIGGAMDPSFRWDGTLWVQDLQSPCPVRPPVARTNWIATRPERAPRVMDHSTARARRVSSSIAEAVLVAIAADHGQVGRLVAVVEAQPKAEAIATATPFRRPLRPA